MFSVRQVPEANSLKALMTGAISKICIGRFKIIPSAPKDLMEHLSMPIMNQDE